MAERRPKRPKISRGEDDYRRGSILEIDLFNFMTFSKLKSKPGSRLNVVIGPNGSGKSSLVCAIALGLGGEPQLLGRATSIGAYVKRGEKEGHIMISLRGEGNEEKLIIMRKIYTDNKSDWLLNGKVVPKKEIIEVVRKLNIQVNNLTQFLPQDRVCEFAKLTPVQLLEETEKAVGDPQLPVQHHTLITKSQELKKLERAIESNRRSLDYLKAANAELERDVERVRQREELLAKAEKMKLKLPWLKYDAKQADYLAAIELEKDAKKKLEEAAKILIQLQEPIEKQKQLKKIKDDERKNISSQIESNRKERLQVQSTLENLCIQVRGKYAEMEDLRKQELSIQESISKAKEDLDAAELELANLPPYEPPKDKLAKLNSQLLELRDTATEIISRKKEQEKLLGQKKMMLGQCLERLRDMETTNSRRLQALRESGSEKIFEAYKWVQEHRHELKKDVYGPVLLEVNVPNPAHADYLEGQVSQYIWRAFITEDDGDRDFLVKNLRPFGVPVINYTGNGGCREPFKPTEQMRRLGIYSRLDEVFDAPYAVKEVLTSQSSLERSYIGSKDTDQKADQVQQLGIMNVWTPENHYQWSKSRYSNHVSASVQCVDRSRLLLSNVDSREIEKLKSRKNELEKLVHNLEGNVKALTGELRRTEDEEATIHKEHEEITKISQGEKKKRREMENRIKERKLKLESMEKVDDLDASMAKLSSQVEELKIQRFLNALKMKVLLVKALAYRKSFAENNMTSIELDAKIKALEGNFKHQEKICEQASQNLQNCKKEVEVRRHHLDNAKKSAESIAVLTPELKQAFLEMPRTIEELDAAIYDTISEANSILLLNDNILEQYEDRRRKIEELTEKLKTEEMEMSRQRNDINSLKESWLLTLRNLVTQINETFSRNFQEMAVAGEVALDEHAMDFDQYGILIKVKFRQAGELKILSAHHQSGGERSVSTILYLVSLQDLTNCPFRVVDEINQGMDPINERKMFQQLVRAASLPNTPQCFLLTPKLLGNLVYTEACTILDIMNGPWLEQASRAWSSGQCWRSVVGLEEETFTRDSHN